MPRETFPLSSLQENSEHPADIVFRYSKWAPFSKRNLAKTVGRECTASPLVSVFLHANVTNIEMCHTTGRVLSIIAKSFSGKTVRHLCWNNRELSNSPDCEAVSQTCNGRFCRKSGALFSRSRRCGGRF